MTRRHPLPLLFLAATMFTLFMHGDARARECRYDVVVTDAIASELSITIECEGGLPRSFVLTEGAPAWAGAMTLSDGNVEVVPDGERWLVPPGTRDGTAKYTLALRAMAETMGRYVSTFRTGPSIFSRPRAWLAVPEPSDGYTIALRFDFPNGGGVATSMPFDGAHHQIAAADVEWAAPTAFGTFERLDIEVPAPSALERADGTTTTIHLVILESSMITSTDVLATWVVDSGHAIAEFWGGFPFERPLLFLVPANGERGSVNTVAGVTVVVMVEHDSEPSELYEQKALIHEMLHLGSPWINDTGEWLNEGTATYYELIVRKRAGWITREEVWREWMDWMPNGLYALDHIGLVQAQDLDAYWGGALFMLLADIELRQESDLALGVEDCLRAVRNSGGTADQTWSTFKFFDLCDETLGTSTLSRLMKSYYRPGDPPDLNALWAKLGVSMADEGSIQFDDTAPLAAVRDAILSGGPNAKWQPVPLRTE